MDCNKSNEFWPNFESFMGQKISIEIIDFLMAGGYANELALKEIDCDDIADMENRLGKCLLPGHRKLIIALGKKGKRV